MANPLINSTFRLVIVCFTIQFSILACSKTETVEEPAPDVEPNPTDTTIVKPVETGTVIGSVILYNLGDRIFPVGVKVTMYNAKDTIRHTITQRSEIFQLEKVPLGTYTVKYERDSMGTVYTYGAVIKQANQSNLLPFMELGFKSFGSISYFKIDTSEAYRFRWNFRVVRDPKPKSIYESTIRYFAARNSNVSSSNYDTSWTIGYGNFFDTSEVSIDYAFFQKLGFIAGDKIYVKAHSDGYYSNSYTEPGKKNAVYPNINPVSPPIDSFVLRY